MRRLTISLWIALATLSLLLGQTNAPPILLYDSSGNPFPTGSGTPLPFNPPPMTCYTIVAGATVPCVFSGGGGGSALTMDNSGSGAASGSTYNGSAPVTLSYNTLGAGALAASNTWTQPNTFTGAGAASTSSVLINGSWITGLTATNTYPGLYVKASGASDGNFQTNGSGLVVNGPSGFNSSGNLIAAQINGAPNVFSVQGNGVTSSTGGFQTGTVVGMGTSGSNALRIQNTGSINWSSTSGFTGTADATLARQGAGVLEVNAGTGAGSTGSIMVATVQAGILYSAAGTPLPTCVAGLKGATAMVSDATTPTYLGTYTSGGAVTSAVLCNGSTWVTH